MAEKMTIEQGFDKLGEIMERMEETDISLEESFRLYNKVGNCETLKTA